LILGLWALDTKRWVLLGIVCPLVVASRSANAIFALGFFMCAVFLGQKKGLIRFLRGALLPTFLLLAYWNFVLLTGLPPDISSESGRFSLANLLPHVLANLISPYRGIVFFSPVSLFAFWGVYLSYQKNPAWPERLKILILAGCSVTSFLVLSSYAAWTGGFSFGPRYLMEGFTVLFTFLPAVVEKVEKEKVLRTVWWMAVFFSIAIQSLGAYGTWRWDDLAEKTKPTPTWKWISHPVGYILGGVKNAKIVD